MPELDPFDARLERAAHAFADSAQTHVDAAAVAERAARGRRTSPWAILGREVPVPVSMLLLLILLLTMMIWTVSGGGFPGRRGDADLRPVPTVAPAVVLPAIPAMRPATDGEGDEILSARELPDLGAPMAEERVGDAVRLAGVFTVTSTTNDPRVRGTATWDIDADLPATETATGFGAGPVRGTYRLVGPDGNWEGTCLGTVLDEPLAITGSCWLAGSGDYAGSTYFRNFTWRFAAPWDPVSGASDGIVYPGAPPEP